MNISYSPYMTRVAKNLVVKKKKKKKSENALKSREHR